MANIDDSEMKLVELIITNPEESELSDGKLKFKLNLQPIHLRFFLGADSDPDGDCELRHLVTGTWGLDRAVYDILIAHGYTREYARTLDEKALNDVFSVAKWTAHKHALRQKLMKWEESILYQEGNTEEAAQRSDSVPVRNEANSAVSGSPQRKLLPTSVSRALLDSILERNEKGKIVCKYFQLHQRLDKQQRKFLAHTIVDYYIASQKYFSLPDMSRFAELIAERFPSEIPVTYYNPRNKSANKRHPSGMLYDRFHNRKKTSPTTISSTPATETTFHSEQKEAALQLSVTGKTIRVKALFFIATQNFPAF
ncbi:uncharacterized protein LOC115258151 [Aedes albopictus]|uniref:Uncharacterized protein n=1 Tax=Aedes albopictus TaxID=7160 RepID=A0ABM1ZWW0_AEDAL